MDSQTEVQIRPPHASIFRQKYKSGHHMHVYSERSSNQATKCMYFWTEVQIRPPHVCSFGQKIHFQTEVQIRPPHACMYFRTEEQIRPQHACQKKVPIRPQNACIHRQKNKLGHRMHGFTDRSNVQAITFTDRITKQATTCMHLQTEVQNQARLFMQENPMNYQYQALFESADEAWRAGVCKVR
jgi:hypothetical protein